MCIRDSIRRAWSAKPPHRRALGEFNWRLPPARAPQPATVNALTGGRLILGVGPSHAPGIEALGLEYSRPARHMREYVSILKALGEEGRVEFDGEMYKMTTLLIL